jgi:hypothetical protein
MYGMGWVVLSDDGGKSRLSFVRPEKIDGVRSGYTLFSDVTGELGGNPSKIAWQILRSGTATGANALLVAQQSGAVSVGSGSFVREVYLADEFVQPTPVGFSLAAYAESDFASVALAADGSVYGRYFDNAATLYIDEFLNFPIEYLGQKVAVRKLINMRAYSGYFTAAALVEDNRILWIGWDNPQLYSPNAVSPSVMVTTVGESFDFTAFGDNQLIYAGMVMRPIGLTSVPMRLIYKSGTEYRMQECTAASPRAMQNATITVTLNEPFVGGEYITDNSVFFQLETKDYLFFAEQNRIWFYERATGQVHNIYNFAEGERVVSMASNPQESELGVALESGKLATIAITNDKLLDSELVGLVEGISGRVVDMRYKFASPLQYNRRTQSNNWD